MITQVVVEAISALASDTRGGSRMAWANANRPFTERLCRIVV